MELYALVTDRSKSSGVTSRKGVQMATAALFTRPSMVGRGERAALGWGTG